MILTYLTLPYRFKVTSVLLRSFLKSVNLEYSLSETTGIQLHDHHVHDERNNLVNR